MRGQSFVLVLEEQRLGSIFHLDVGFSGGAPVGRSCGMAWRSHFGGAVASGIRG